MLNTNAASTASMRFGDYITRYMGYVLLRCKNGSDFPPQVEKVLRRFAAYTNTLDLPISEITNMTVVSYLTSRRKDSWRGKPLKNVTLNNEIRILNAAFAKAGPVARGRCAENWGLIPTPPFACELPEPFKNAVVVEDEQLSTFLEAARRSRTPHPEVCPPGLFWESVLLLEMTTRLRREALLNIPRPDDRDLLERRLITLPAEFNKTEQELVFPLGGEVFGSRVVDVLSQLPSVSGEPILPWKTKTGERMTRNYFSYCVREIQRKAGISDRGRIRIKDLRSTGGTLIADEFGDAVAKKALGHSPNTNTIQTNYKCYQPRDKDRQASDFMAGMAMKFLKPEPSGTPPDTPSFFDVAKEKVREAKTQKTADEPVIIRFPGVA